MVTKSKLKSTTAVPASKFTLVVNIEALGHKVGDTLSEPRHVLEWLETFIPDDAGDAVKDKLAKATPAQKMIVLQSVKTKDMTNDKGEPDHDAINDAYLNALLAAPFAVDTSEIPPIGRVRGEQGSKGSASVQSVKYGAMVADDTVADINSTMKAIVEGDAGPIMLAHRLLTQFKDVKDTDTGMSFFDMVPPIGSKYRTQGTGKGNKAPTGYRLPNDTTTAHGNVPVWHGPYDYYTADVTLENGLKDTAPTHWTGEFVSAKIAAGLFDRVSALRSMIKNKGSLPERDERNKEYYGELRALVKDGDDDRPNRMKLLEDHEAELSFQFSRRVRMTSAAFQLIQGMRAIHERWPNTTVELFGVTELEEAPLPATRRRKPYSLVIETPHKDGRPRVNSIGPLTASVIKGAVNKIATLQDKAAISDFLAKKTRETGGTQAATPKGPTATTPHVQTITQFQDYLSEVHGYLTAADKTKLILDKCNAPDGGEFCSAVVSVYEALSEVASIRSVKAKADAYDTAVGTAQAEADKAKAETKAA